MYVIDANYTCKLVRMIRTTQKPSRHRPVHDRKPTKVIKLYQLESGEILNMYYSHSSPKEETFIKITKSPILS